MLYYFEYELKGGQIKSGHNVIDIEYKNDMIKLRGVKIEVNDGLADVSYWRELINMHDISYFKIVPEILTLKEVE